MKIKKENKKAELTSNQLVTIIILIISFAIIVVFFVMLNLRQTIDKESCRNSVIMKTGLSIKGFSPISLKCKTQDICLSMGGDCESAGKDAVKTAVESEQALIREMAGLIYDCWWMMGEGKVDYGSKGSCAICYKVYFDSVIKNKYSEGIPYSYVYNYMATSKIPNTDRTYLYAFYQLSSLESVRNKLASEDNYGIDINTEKIDVLKEPYVVVDSIFVSREKDKTNAPTYVQFSANELRENAKCSNFVTEA